MTDRVTAAAQKGRQEGLVFKIDTLMKARHLTQVEAAALFGVRQPDVSKMLRGEFRQFSVERLLRFLGARSGRRDRDQTPQRSPERPRSTSRDKGAARRPQVAGPWISGAPIVVLEIMTGDHSECTDDRKRPGLGAAQRVLAIAVVNELALWSARQVNMSAECIRDVALAFSIVVISVDPAGIVIAIASVLV